MALQVADGFFKAKLLRFFLETSFISGETEKFLRIDGIDYEANNDIIVDNTYLTFFMCLPKDDERESREFI